MIDWEDVLDLKSTRQELGLSQVQLATLLGVSPRTVQSCEQGWRNPSPALERSILLLRIAHRQGTFFGKHACWKSINCREETRADCVTYRTRQGHLCWLVGGNLCQGKAMRTWNDKKDVCGNCEFLHELLDGRPR